MYLCTDFRNPYGFHKMKTRSNGSELIKNLVILGDFVLLNVLLLLFKQIAPDILPNFFETSPKTELFVGNISLLISEYYFHTHIHERRESFSAVWGRCLRLCVCQAILFFVASRLVGGSGGFFYFIFYYIPIFYICLLIVRAIELYILRRYRQAGGNTRRVLFIGSDMANEAIYNDLMTDPTTGYKVVGYYSNFLIKDAPEGFTHLGSLSDLQDLIEKNEIGEDIHDVFCCLSHDMYSYITNIIHWCDRQVIHFYYVPRMEGNDRLKLKPETFGDQTLFTNFVEPLANRTNRFIKRTFDIVFSIFALIFLLPFIPIIALMIKIQSPGPLLFKQKRTGLNGEEFYCYKFRSMHVNKEADTLQATKDDPRKFAFGNFMRKTNIDEFPQFFNVLRGDMSIVGPRPHMLKHTEQYSELIDKYMVRHFSKPGITGWAQVTGFRGETETLDQMEGRIKKDIWYIENWTFWLDIKIIALTALSIIKPDKKAY